MGIPALPIPCLRPPTRPHPRTLSKDGALLNTSDEAVYNELLLRGKREPSAAGPKRGSLAAVSTDAKRSRIGRDDETSALFSPPQVPQLAQLARDAETRISPTRPSRAPPVDRMCEVTEPTHVLHRDGEIYDALLIHTDIGKNKNK